MKQMVILFALVLVINALPSQPREVGWPCRTDYDCDFNEQCDAGHHCAKTQVNADSMDLRVYGAILPPPKLSKCDHANVVNTIDMLSAKVKLGHGKDLPLTQLSRQQIYDCQGNNTHFCPCGTNPRIFDVMAETLSKPMDPESDVYPFTEQCTRVCKMDAPRAFAMSSGTMGSDGKGGVNENTYKTLLMNGPLTVEFNSKSKAFQDYKGGIFSDPQCSTNKADADHSLLLVGYGSQNGTDFWIFRNSYGLKWGEQGYIRIVRDKNVCGLGNAMTQYVLAAPYHHEILLNVPSIQ